MLITTRPGQECLVKMVEHGGRKQELVITEHNAGLSVTLELVMNGGSPVHDTQAENHQRLWATESYEAINHATQPHPGFN